MINFIKKNIPLKYKEYVLYVLGLRNYKQYKNIDAKNKIFVFLATDYRNIGDAAITYSQVNILKQAYADYKVIEVPLRHTLSHMLAIKLTSKKSDIITIIGGGHLGDLYYGVQDLKHRIIKSFPQNQIISFPQSNNFKPENKNSRIDSAIKIYQGHSNLTLLLRDEASLSFIKNKMPNVHAYLCPDIVLTQDMSENQKKRSGILLMLRNDVESSLTQENKQMAKNIVSDFDNNFEELDTLYKDNMADINFRNSIFNNFIENIKSKSLVITDRLHGVIFCYITKTPCIAINSKNNKVKNAITSYMECEYIHIQEGISESQFNKKVEFLLKNTDNFDYTNKTKEYYNIALSLIK